MTDLVFLAILIATATVSVVLTAYHGRGKWQQILWRDISRDLDRHHDEVLRHCRQIQNHLDRHDRTLQYLARRLS